MRLGPLELSWTKKSAEGLSIEQVIQRLEGAWNTAAGITVSPENCMRSPTMLAIVTAISRRISTLPIEVLQVTEKSGRTRKEVLPKHPVAMLLKWPNDWQDSNQFWLDATSQLVRYGNFFAHKSRGSTGPVRALYPLKPTCVSIDQDSDWSVTYRYSTVGGASFVVSPDKVLHARGPARDMLKGDSPVMDISEAIALEIQAERMGAAVFGNTAQPGVIFKFSDASQGYRTDEERQRFVESFQALYGGAKRFTAALLPKGIEVADTAAIDNEKAQYTDTRQYQRTVIAAAFGVPPHMVGDLAKGTFNNVEQQTLDFVINVVLPYCRQFEAAMERSLLTAEDRARGVIIRFNLEGILRGDFKTRQDGLNIQRQAGVISANDWREKENMNPIPARDGGDEYWRKGPSGQDASAPGAGNGQPPVPAPTTEDTTAAGEDDNAE